MDAGIEVRGLSKRFGDLVAVAGIDFDARTAECLAILGPNGAGKTTTLEILEGLQAPTAGSVRVLGRSWDQDPDELRRRIGIQLQESHFPGKATVEEVVRVFRAFYPSGMEVEEALEVVGLKDKRSARVEELSGGQKQRLALAVAIAPDPELVFLDEPTTGLDPHARRDVWAVIQALKARRRTLILTTHYMEEAERVADRVIIMDRGRIVASGTPAAMIASLGIEQVARIACAPPLPAEAVAGVEGVLRAEARAEVLEVSVKSLHAALPRLLEEIKRRGSEVTHLSTRQASLDDVFVSVTGRRLEPGDAQPAA